MTVTENGKIQFLLQATVIHLITYDLEHPNILGITGNPNKFLSLSAQNALRALKRSRCT